MGTRRTSRRNGQALLIMTFSLIFLFAVMGLSVDLGYAYYLKARVQTSADSAATAAAVWAANAGDTCATVNCGVAYNCAGTTPPTTSMQAGCLYATTDGPPSMSATMLENSSGGPNGTNPTMWIKATVSTSAPNFFLFGSGYQVAQVAAQSIAGVTTIPPTNCVYQLSNTNISGAITVSGSSNITANGCGVFANSTSSSAIVVSGSSSHEMRTPLNAILGTTEMAMDEELSDSQQHCVTRIRKNADTLLTLISDLLDISKIEAGQFDWESAPFDLPECLRQAVNPAAERAAQKGLVFEMRLDSELPKRAMGDSGRLRQVVANLAENAVKFTDSGFIRIEAWLVPGVGRCPGELKIRVADSGAGIPEEARPHIFERFFQGDGSTRRRNGGAGLGLSIVDSLVKAAGGSISLVSLPGRGTEFCVRIPLGTPQFSALPDAAPQEFPAKVQTDRLHTGASVLVVEDNEDNFAIVQRYLQNAGYKVSRACDGREAVAAAATGFDLILMDVEMPGMDGLEATRAIRAEEKLAARPTVPVIALTAHAVKGYRARCLEAGCNSYLSKPIRKATLIEAVEAALSAELHLVAAG